jgi:TRAP-type C4-dicarboxylate transport system permease large subunit
MLFGSGFNHPLIVGIIGSVALFVFVLLSMRTVFAAAHVGLAELNGWDAAAGIVGIVHCRLCCCKWLADPDQSSALGAAVAFIVAAMKGTKLKAITKFLIGTAKRTVMIVSLIWGVTVFVRFLGISSVAEAFSQCVTTIDAPPVVIFDRHIAGLCRAWHVHGCNWHAVAADASKASFRPSFADW